MSAAAFREAMAGAGIVTDADIRDDGELCRFHVEGDKAGSRNGWAALYLDGIPAGCFGSWRTGETHTWCGRKVETLTTAERQAYARKLAAAKRQREAAEVERHADTAASAANEWDAAIPETGAHRYLIDKGVKAYGLRTNGVALLVPLRDSAGNLSSIQRIRPDGTKRFLPGGAIRGRYHAIGKPAGRIIVCEGYATGATLHEATGCAVAVAFNCGNLLPVAEALRAKYPEAVVVIAADDDSETTGNPGRTHATGAAQTVRGLLAVPDFGASRPAGASDFNDLARITGTESVRAQIDAAQSVEPETKAADDSGIAGPGMVFDCAADLEMKPISWLWHGRIARGKVTLIAGHPGLGKSQITASLAAITSTGGRWPVDRSTAPRGNVVILSAEDDPSDTILPRLVAAGAVLERVFCARAVLEHNDDGTERQRQFDLGRDLVSLDGMLATIGGAVLIVIDPLTAYLGGIDSHRTSDVRGLLAPLSEFAERHRAAVVCVSHLRKQGGDALMAVTGSLAFVAAARAAFIVTKDPEDDRRRLLLPAKNNIGPDTTGYSYAIETATAGSIETSRVVWHSEPVTITADEAMGRSADGGERSERADAAAWLRAELAEGPVSAKDLQRAARDAGHAWPTIRRAKDDIGVRVEKAAFSGGWRWALEGDHDCPNTPNRDHLRGDNSKKPSNGAASSEDDHLITLGDHLRHSDLRSGEGDHLRQMDTEPPEGDHEDDHDIGQVITFDETRASTGFQADAAPEGDHGGVCAELGAAEPVESASIREIEL